MRKMKVPEEVKTFDERLRHIMLERHITQRGLAAAMGVQYPTISMYCTGKCKPGYEALIRLSKALGVTTDWLCGLEDDDGQSAQS